MKTYTLLKHVIGEDYQKYTGVSEVEIKVHKEADIHEMMQAFKCFLLAIGYSKDSIDPYIEDD